MPKKITSLFGGPFKSIRLFALLCLLTLLVPSCARAIKMEEIDPSVIPESLKRSAEESRRFGGKEIEKVTWRVFEKQGAYQFFAYEVKLKEKFYDDDHFVCYGHIAAGPKSGSSSMIPFPKGTRALFFAGVGRHSHRNPDGTMTEDLEASGLALDARIAKIVGSTSSGIKVETTPTNGFWWLIVENVKRNERFTSLKAVTAKGWVLYEVDKRQLQ